VWAPPPPSNQPFWCNPPIEAHPCCQGCFIPYRRSVMWYGSHGIQALSGYPACNVKQEFVNIVIREV